MSANTTEPMRCSSRSCRMPPPFEFSPICNVFKVVAEKIRSELPVVDISAVMGEVEALLNRSIAADGYVMPPVSNDPSRFIDLSQIDFDALKVQFDKGRRSIE